MRKKNKVFIACDSSNISKIKKIIKETPNNELKIGYKFGLEFLNSKKGRKFISKLKNKITFGDYKFNDIPNTCVSAIKTIRDLKFNNVIFRSVKKNGTYLFSEKNIVSLSSIPSFFLHPSLRFLFFEREATFFKRL